MKIFRLYKKFIDKGDGGMIKLIKIRANPDFSASSACGTIKALKRGKACKG